MTAMKGKGNLDLTAKAQFKETYIELAKQELVLKIKEKHVKE